MVKRLLSILALVSCLSLCAFSQQPQTQTAPLFDVNAQYVQGLGPGYWPTAGTGLVLNIAAGTCWTGSAFTNYAGGTLTLTASTTSYIYVNVSTCAPAVSATPQAAGIATVVTGATSITSITDDRTWFAASVATSFSQLTGTIAASQLAAGPAPDSCLWDNDSGVLTWIGCLPLTLQTNGTNNAIQSIINFKNGTDVSVVADPAGSGAETISFTGTLPASQANTAHEWLNSYTPSTGVFTVSQPASSDLSDFPAQTGNSGKFLTTNGTSLSWGSVSSANAIVNNPSASQTITPGNSTTTGLIIQGNGGTTTDAFDVYQNGWEPLRVTPFGQVYITHSPSVDSLNIDINQNGAVLNFGGIPDHITFQHAGNSDIQGKISITSSTSGSYTFATPYGSAPSCTVTQEGLSASPTVFFGENTSTTALTVYASASGTYTVDYHCFGSPN